jgi:signal transduction histidine kinase
LVDINKCVQDYVTLFRTECDRQHISCIVELKPDLPPVEAGRQQLQEAFNHLIENALQAMPAGGSLCVRTLMTGSTSAVFSERHTGRVAIEVVDTGCGINPDYLAQIFQPFSRRSRPGAALGSGSRSSRKQFERTPDELRSKASRTRGPALPFISWCPRNNPHL